MMSSLTTGELRVRQQLQKVGKRLVLQELKTEKSRRTLALPQVCWTRSAAIEQSSSRND